MNVSLSSLSVSYGATEVLHDISAAIPEGQWFAPIGPNGAGKSTLLMALAGQLAYRGAISIGEDALPRSRMALARLVAFVPQRPVLPSTMAVADYVMLGRSAHIGYLGSEKPGDHTVVADVLERLDIARFSRRALGALSGGEAQRCVLARALAQRAPVLLLDEPTASLDIGQQQLVLELVDVLRRERGLTVISAMHDLTLAGQFADVICLLVNGRVIANGPPEEVLSEENITAHYGATVEVRSDAGRVLVLPLRRGV